MSWIGLLGASIVAIVAGVAIGATPVVNEHLHWNFWLVIPISGAVLGAALGWGQFQIARASGARVGKAVAAGLALATALGYLGTDLGTYGTMTVELEGGEGFEGGTYPLRDLIGFDDYMRARLSSSSIDLRPGRSDSTVELGATAATASFGADLLGAWLGAFLMLIGSAAGAPYCDRCRKYKKRVAKMEIALHEDTAVETLEQLQQSAQSELYEPFVSLLNETAKQPAPPQVVLKLVTDERVCPGCNEATLIARVMRAEGNEWKEALELRVSSTPGDTARLAPGA